MSTSIQNYKNIIFLIILAEILSFLGYYYQLVNFIVFFAISIFVLILSLYRLEYGLFVLLAELFIGSFGYLFYFEQGGLKISVRLALWLIMVSVWSAKTIIEWIKTKKLSINFFQSSYFSYFIVLFIFIAWGLANGLVSKNSPGNIFFDFNNWLYFLVIFPIFSVLQNDDNIKIAKQIFFAAITWLSLKTIILAYFFSHNFNGFIFDLYRWVRTSGVGEITQVQGGFSRIFMQSHIFVLLGFFILLFYLLKLINEQKIIFFTRRSAGLVGLLALFLSAILISFSRSFWIGLAAGGIFIWSIILFKLKIKFKQFVIFNSLILLSLILSLIFALAIVKFPYPWPYGGFDATELLSARATQIAGETGASSRWQLLPPLWQKIKSAPILGRGFGATVTYKTNDPRILASHAGGEYTTYAFEWGWLDIWLKLGLFGLLAYLVLFAKVIFNGLKINSYFSLALITGLVILMAVNMFSPYVNHPLGIGYLIITTAVMERMNN